MKENLTSSVTTSLRGQFLPHSRDLEMPPARDQAEAFSVRLVLLLTAAFLLFLILPLALTALSGSLEQTVIPSYQAGTETITLAPAAGWQIQNVLPRGESPLTAEAGAQGVLVDADALPADELQQLQLLCRDQSGRTVSILCSLLRERSGTVTVRSYPLEGERFGVSYLHTFANNA